MAALQIVKQGVSGDNKRQSVCLRWNILFRTEKVSFEDYDSSSSFANIAKNKEDSFTLEILNITSHVDYIHDERLGVFQLKHLLSFLCLQIKRHVKKPKKRQNLK